MLTVPAKYPRPIERPIEPRAAASVKTKQNNTKVITEKGNTACASQKTLGEYKFATLVADQRFILDINGRTSRGHTEGRSHRISHPPSFCGACLNFSREKDSAIPFPHRPRSRILCTNDFNRSPPVGHFYFCFFSEKNPVCRDRTHVPTCQRVTRYL